MTFSEHEKIRRADRRAFTFAIFTVAIVILGTVMGLLARAGIVR